MEKSKTATGVDPGFSEGGLAVMHGKGEGARESMEVFAMYA